MLETCTPRTKCYSLFANFAKTSTIYVRCKLPHMFSPLWYIIMLIIVLVWIGGTSIYTGICNNVSQDGSNWWWPRASSPNSHPCCCHGYVIFGWMLHLLTGNVTVMYTKIDITWWRHQMETFFRVTVHLCGEFTGPRWIPSTKASDAELWCFLWSAPE